MSRRKRGQAAPLTLKRHLDGATQAELLEFLRFWSPHEKHGNGRTALVHRLQRLMGDENTVYAKVELLSETVRSVLLALLRKSQHTSDLQGLFRGLDGLDLEFYEGEAALTALSRRGFVRVSRAQEWLHYGRSAYAIPREMALAMRGLAGADRRTFEQVFSHASFRAAAVEAAADLLPAPLPDSVAAAVAALPEPVRTVAAEVVDRFGGILTRREFPAVFEERGIRWASASFLEELGAAGLGTVGHLDLRDRGIAVDDDVVVVFHEAVERWFAGKGGAPPAHDHVLRGHGDLMSDVRTALAMVREMPVRVSKGDSVYKAARARIAERLQFPQQPLLDRDDVAGRAIAIARGLGLADTTGEGELVLTAKGEEWMRLPLLEKVRGAYGLVLQDGGGTLRSHHLRRVQAILVELLADPERRGWWWPTPSLSMLARNRYLLELAREEPPTAPAPTAAREAALTALGKAAQDLVLRDFFALGLVAVAVRGDEPVAVRLSALGRRVLLGEEPRAGAARPLVVNPDFEMLVLPEGDVDDLLHDLDRIAVRVRTGEVVQYRLDRERIERVAVAGEPPEAILETLRAHARAPLPQNVEYTVRAWAGDVRSASLAEGILFRASDSSVVEAVLADPALRECVLEVLGPAAVFFHPKVMERRIAQELRALGVYLR